MCSCLGFADGLFFLPSECFNTHGDSATSWMITKVKKSDSIVDLSQLSTLQLCICVIRELKLRNYTPEDEELKQRKVPNAQPASGNLILQC